MALLFVTSNLEPELLLCPTIYDSQDMLGFYKPLCLCKHCSFTQNDYFWAHLYSLHPHNPRLNFTSFLQPSSPFLSLNSPEDSPALYFHDILGILGQDLLLSISLSAWCLKEDKIKIFVITLIKTT